MAVKILALAALAALVAGCGHMGRTGIDTAKLLVTSRASVSPSAEDVEASPYAQIQVDWPQGSAVMVLGNVDDGRQSWFTSRDHLVYLRDGLVVGSFGFGDDAADIRIVGDNPLLRLQDVHGAAHVRREYDWRNGYRYGVPVAGEVRRLGTRQVDILGTPRSLVHYREQLRGPGLDDHNDYWADPITGFIWKSRQVVAPDLVVEIVQLKPYQADMR